MTETPPPSPVAPSDPTLADPTLVDPALASGDPAVAPADPTLSDPAVADRVLADGPSTADPRSEIAAYAAEVRAALADLDAEELDDILDDLMSHLREVRASADAPLDEVVGRPRAYAAELRASAGLPPVPPPPPPPPGGAAAGPTTGPVGGEASAQPGPDGGPNRTVLVADPLTRWVDDARVSVRERWDQVRAHQWWHELVAFLPELRPAWWVARAWLIVVLVASLTSGAASGPLWLVAPPVFGNSVLGLLVLAGAVVFSVRRGRSPAPGGPNRRLVGTLVVGAAILGLLLFTSIDSSGGSGFSSGAGYDSGFDDGYSQGLSEAQAQSAQWSGSGEGEVLNVYAYLPDGTPIDQVLLFDEQGRPLVVGGNAGVPGPGQGRVPYSVEAWSPVLSEQVEVVFPLDADGQPIANLYPRRLAAPDPESVDGQRRRMVPPPDVVDQFPPTTPAPSTPASTAPLSVPAPSSPLVPPPSDVAPGTTVPTAPPVTPAAGPGPTQPGTPVEPGTTVEPGTPVEPGTAPAPGPDGGGDGSGTGGGS